MVLHGGNNLNTERYNGTGTGVQTSALMCGNGKTQVTLLLQTMNLIIPHQQ